MNRPAEHYTRVFSQLGRQFKLVASALERKERPGNLPRGARELFRAATGSSGHNPWFTAEQVSMALYRLSEMLAPEQLLPWLESYPELDTRPGKGMEIGVVMAGNIPLVGFHDMMCVLACGCSFTGKLSSSDKLLPPAVAKMIQDIDRETAGRIKLVNELPGSVDAVIATGSDNSARYFEYYYSGTPKIIRGNRNSAAVLSGTETASELRMLGEDVFSYYGLGCRNVSFLLLPEGFNPESLARQWKRYDSVLDNQKYLNNYKYQKARLFAGGDSFIDTGNALLIESASTASPVSVINYMHYKERDGAAAFLRLNENRLQCVVGKPGTLEGVKLLPFGGSQRPGPADYADGIDTIGFITRMGRTGAL